MNTQVYKVNYYPEPYSCSSGQTVEQATSVVQERLDIVDHLPSLLPDNAKPMQIHGPVLCPHTKRNGQVVIKPIVQSPDGAFYSPGTSLSPEEHATQRNQVKAPPIQNVVDLTALPNLVNQTPQDLPPSQRTECSTNNPSINSQTFSNVRPQEQDSGLTLLQKKQLEHEIVQVPTTPAIESERAMSYIESPKIQEPVQFALQTAEVQNINPPLQPTTSSNCPCCIIM